jgi:hypothetical protein
LQALNEDTEVISERERERERKRGHQYMKKLYKQYNGFNISVISIN